jgi:hypothetical protein
MRLMNVVAAAATIGLSVGAAFERRDAPQTVSKSSQKPPRLKYFRELSRMGSTYAYATEIANRDCLQVKLSKDQGHYAIMC